MKLKAFCSVTFFYFLIFAFLFIGKCLHAQITSDTSQQTKEYYKRGKINLGEKKVYVIKNIIIEKDSVLFTDVVTSMDHIAAISDIKELQIKTGTKAIGSAALGLALVFILTLETMVDNEPNPDDIALRYSASLIMGALIGAGIGLAIPVRQTYDFNTRSLQSK
jgi:hypothetical protein